MKQTSILTFAISAMFLIAVSSCGTAYTDLLKEDSAATKTTVSTTATTPTTITVAAPTISVSGSGVARSVSITTSTSGATIYVTTDGSTPTVSSKVYSGAITVAGFGVTKTIQAIAVASGTSSAAASASVSIGSVLTLGGTVKTLSTAFTPYTDFPLAITSDGTNLYLTNCGETTGNSGPNTILKLDGTGAVTTLAGSTTYGSTDGPGSTATFSTPSGITTDGTYLYVADTEKIRRVNIATKEVDTLVGGFNGLGSITTDGITLYATDTQACLVYGISIADGTKTPIAGSGNLSSDDGTGTGASFAEPTGIATDGTRLYVADSLSGKIRRVVIATGEVSTLASISNPLGLATDGGYIYATKDSAMVSSATTSASPEIDIIGLTVNTLAGSGTAATADGTGSSASFNSPAFIATDGTSLYVTDPIDAVIRKIQ